MKIPSSEHVVYINCYDYQNKNKKQFVYTTCSELGIFMYWTGDSMDNLLSYYGLVDAKIRASDKDLPVHIIAGKYINTSHATLIHSVKLSLFVAYHQIFARFFKLSKSKN